MVAARSVRLVGDKTDFRERREKWWNELRDEVRGHCEMYKCDCVLGYTETLSTASGVCIMYNPPPSPRMFTTANWFYSLRFN
jgi:hypothetical protein